MHEQLKPFVKGDPRINRRGRPREFNQLRTLAQQIANEDVDGVLRVEKILRALADGDAKQQQFFLEVAFGKVPPALPEEVERGPLRLTIDMRSPEAREADSDGP